MKKTNAVLTAGIFVSVVLAIVIPIACTTVYYAGVDMGSATAFTLCGLPFFFLQWRLCRAVKEKWVMWVPIGILCVVALLSAVQFILNEGSWDSIIGLLGLIFCLSPAAGIFLGWMAHGKKLAFLGVAAAVAVYLIANRVPFLQRPAELLDAAAAVVLAAGIYLLFRDPQKALNAE